MTSLAALNREILACRACPRLVAHVAEIGRVRRRAYRDQTYHAAPVPGFGDPRARVVIVGLAPGAHGSNRTGRMFTGDGSGNWLFRALHETGYARIPTGLSVDDGQKLTDAYLTAVGRCAPPDNKPTPEELRACRPFLMRELDLLTETLVLVALGKVAFDALWDVLIRKEFELPRPRLKFGHGAEMSYAPNRLLLASYHPSQQNTLTGKLTPAMLRSIFERAREFCERGY